MAIISKLDNELTQLLKAQIALNNNPEQQGTIRFFLPNDELGEFVDEKYLIRGLDDIADLELIKAEKLFLQQNKRLKPGFIDYIDTNKYLMSKIIKNKGKVVAVEITGKMADLILTEMPITILLNEMIITNQAIKTPINLEFAFMEGARRLQAKLDFVRWTDGYKIYLGGMRDRVSNDWYAAVSTSIIEDVKDNIVGTNHLLSSFVFNIPSEGYLTEDRWAKDWDKKDIAPSIEVYNDGWEGLRIAAKPSLITSQGKLLIHGKPLDLVGTIQNSSADITVEWDAGIADDIGIDFKKIEISRKILH